MLITAIVTVTSQQIHGAKVEVAQQGNSLEIQCPPDLVLCPSQSTDPSATGYPTVLTSCLPVDQLTFTYYDQHNGDVISREWAVYDPSCAYAQFCTQQITVVQQDDPTMVITDLYGGLVTRFEAVGTRGTIVNATWNFNGATLTEGNGVHFLNAAHSAVEIDFTIFPDATPGDFYNVFVSVQTSCTAQGGAGAGGAVPPLYTLSRGQTTASSSDVSVANTVVTVDCNGSQIAFDAQSRWFRFQVADAGLASIHVTNPSAHLAALVPGTNPALPQAVACGVQDIQFSAEAGKTYIIVVSGETSFTLSAQSTLTPPQILCPPNVSICASDSSDPSSTGFPTLISACSPADQVQITHEDTSFTGGIQRTWTAIDPVCGTSDPCIQTITIFAKDNPTISVSSQYSSLIVTFSATGTRRPISSANWNIKGIPLAEGNGVHFLNDTHTALTIDFTLIDVVSPTEGYNIHVDVQTGCGVGGAGQNTTAPPLYTLSRSLSPTVPSTDVDVANTSIDINCNASLPTTFGNGSRWFRFKIDDAQRGLATIVADNASARLTALAPGVSPTQPLPIICGTSQIQFVAEPATTYIVVVDGADNFVLTPTIADITRVINLTGNLAFGDHQVGTASKATLTIANPGNSTLTVNSLTYPAGFIGDWPGGTIAAGGSQDVNIIFAPTAPIAYGGDIVVDCDSTTGNKTIAVSGAGIATRIITLTGNLAFGEIQVGATKTATLRISNDGNSTLTINGISYPTGFNGNSASGTIVPGAFQDVRVTFSPTAPTPYAGEIAVDCDATAGPKTIAASGSGAATRIISLTGDLAFGPVDVNGMKTATLKISNTGNSPLMINAIMYPVGFGGDWAGLIAAGASQDIVVTFRPSTPIDYGGEVAIDCDATSGRKTIPISGSGIATRIINLSGNLGFGNVPVGATKTATLKISNDGNSPLTVAGLTFPTGFTGDWPSGTIEPAASRDVTVTFNPSSPIIYDGDVLVDCDATSGQKTIHISGSGYLTKFVPADLQTPADGKFHLSLLTEPGKTVVVQVSDDLVNWSDIATLQSLAGDVKFDDQLPVGTEHRFYRFRVE